MYDCNKITDVYFIRSRKGKLLMVVNDFSFCEESMVKGKIIWRCTSKKGKCRARIHTVGNKVIYAKGLHNHPQRTPYVQGQGAKTQMYDVLDKKKPNIPDCA
jgi:hypothetical protein